MWPGLSQSWYPIFLDTVFDWFSGQQVMKCEPIRVLPRDSVVLEKCWPFLWQHWQRCKGQAAVVICLPHGKCPLLGGRKWSQERREANGEGSVVSWFQHLGLVLAVLGAPPYPSRLGESIHPPSASAGWGSGLTTRRVLSDQPHFLHLVLCVCVVLCLAFVPLTTEGRGESDRNLRGAVRGSVYFPGAEEQQKGEKDIRKCRF